LKLRFLDLSREYPPRRLLLCTQDLGNFPLPETNQFISRPLILILSLRPSNQCLGLFPSRFVTKTLHALLSSQNVPAVLNVIVLLIFGFEVKITKIFAQFASATCYFPQLGLISSSELCYRTPVYVFPVIRRLICIFLENNKNIFSSVYFVF